MAKTDLVLGGPQWGQLVEEFFVSNDTHPAQTERKMGLSLTELTGSGEAARAPEKVWGARTSVQLSA